MEHGEFSFSLLRLVRKVVLELGDAFVGSNRLESKLVVFELNSQRKFFFVEDREESQVLNFLSG